VSAITGIVVLVATLTAGLLITRIATVMLVFTGLSRDFARFQARSAFTCCGFTTSEAEQIVQHPVRRRIIMLLMLMGNGTVVLAISSLIPVFVSVQDEETDYILGVIPSGVFYRILWMAFILLFFWLVAASKWIDKKLSRIIAWALKRFTDLEVHDYHGLLHFSEGYAVREVPVEAGDWVVGKNLIELRLGDEGVQVLGIRRASGSHIGAPTGSTYIRGGDTLILYGRSENLSELATRKSDKAGDVAHERWSKEQQRLLDEQKRSDGRPPRGAPESEDVTPANDS
jgi:K+/H+ antiporter YhaU regulatory subunit KhtT